MICQLGRCAMWCFLVRGEPVAQEHSAIPGQAGMRLPAEHGRTPTGALRKTGCILNRIWTCFVKTWNGAMHRTDSCQLLWHLWRRETPPWTVTPKRNDDGCVGRRRDCRRRRTSSYQALTATTFTSSLLGDWGHR